MDSFKIIVIIFMIIIIIKVFIFDNNNKETFNNSEQIGGVDDANAINTLAQLARKLMDGGAKVPGNLTADKVSLGAKFQLSGVGDGMANDEWLRVVNPADATKYSGGLAAGKLYAQTEIITDGAIKFKNKWMIGGSGGGSGDDEWVRMTGLDNKTYYGGFAAGKLWTNDQTINGRNIFAEIDDLKANAVRKNKDFTIGLRDQGNGAVGGGTTLGACGSACGGGANLTGTTDPNRTLILQIRQ